MKQHQGTTNQQVQSSVPIVDFNHMPSYQAPAKPIDQTSYNPHGQQTYRSAQSSFANHADKQQSQYTYHPNCVNNQPTSKYGYHQSNTSHGASKQNEMHDYFSHNKISAYDHDKTTACSNDCCSNIHSQLTASTTSSAVTNSYQSNYIADQYQQPNGYFQTKDQFGAYPKTPVSRQMDYHIQPTSLNQHPSTFHSMHGKYFNPFEIVPIQII